MTDEVPFYLKRILYEIPGMKNVAVKSDVTYKSTGDVDLKMNVYTPGGISPDARLPGVVFIHGGPLPADMQPLPKDWSVYISYGELAAASGCVGITFNHRFYESQPVEQSLQDVTAAIDYVRKEANSLQLDAGRLCLWAFSGGGPHLYLALHERPSYVRCIVAYYAFLLDPRREKEISPTASDQEVRELSLARYLRKDATADLPILIARAGLDYPLLNRVTDAFVQEALVANSTLDLLNHPQGRHAFDILDDNARTREILARTIEFVKVHLGNG